MKRIPFILFLLFFGVAYKPATHVNFASERAVNLKMTFKFDVTGHINRLRFRMMIPADIKDRQKMDDLSFSIQPDSIYHVNNNTYALFKFTDIEKDFKIVVKDKMTIYNSIRLETDSAAADLDGYLVAEPYIETNSEKIIAIAKDLKRKTDIETIIETFNYVKQHISYEVKDAVGAEKVLESGVGKCMDYSDLFVALLRANKIPAKSMFGIVVHEVSSNPLHAWSEAYLKKQGWVRFDATTGHSDITRDGNNYKMRITNKYVTLSEGRNDPELRASLYHYNYNYAPGGALKVKHDVDIYGQ